MELQRLLLLRRGGGVRFGQQAVGFDGALPNQAAEDCEEPADQSAAHNILIVMLVILPIV